jgi:hypothetical protein
MVENENKDLEGQEGQESPENQNDESATPTPTPEPVAAPSTPPVSEEEEDDDMEKATVKSVSMKWGLILGVISIALFIVYVIIDVVGESWVSWMGLIPFIIVVVLAHKEFKDEGDGFMSYGQGLGIGVLVSLISAIISSAFNFIYVKFIDTEFNTKLMEKIEMQWEEQGMTDQQIDAARGFTETMMSPGVGFFIGIAFAVFFGFLVSLIIAAITKNANPEAEI